MSPRQMEVRQTERPQIYEIRVRKVIELTPEAQQEVTTKLIGMPEGFKYKGYAKVTYMKASPLSISSVDPIEGTAIDFFKYISETIQR